MAKYSKKSAAKVETAMKEMKSGTLKSGRSGQIVTNPKQAIAIGLSEARKERAKMPKKASAKAALPEKAPHRKVAAKKVVAKKATPKKAAKKTAKAASKS